MLRIIAVTGSSGGHIFPAMAFLDALKEQRPDVRALLVLPRRGMGRILAGGRSDVRFLSSRPLGAGITAKNLSSAACFIKSAIESLKILLHFKPDIVVGFGTQDCAAIVMNAWLFRARTMIHEQNVMPGKANRILARFVDKIAVSFPETRLFLGVHPSKIALTGNPLRRDLAPVSRADAARVFSLRADITTVLVMGGSQGSSRINGVFMEAAVSAIDPSRVQIIHISGERDYESVRRAYERARISARVFSFLTQMHCAYSLSDLAVCRAGAATVTELLAFGVPALLVPYPFARAHQMENARVLKKNGAAVVIDDAALTPVSMCALLKEFLNDPGRLHAMRDNCIRSAPPADAARRLVQEACALVESREPQVVSSEG